MPDATGAIEAPFEGRVDALNGGEVSGWVWFPSAPDEAAVIEIVIEGEVRGRVVADQLRGDLAEAGKRGGRCAFSWPAPTEPATMLVRLADGRELPGSPILPRLAFEGRVDVIDPQRVAGWCWFPTRPDLTPKVRVRAGAAIAGEGNADRYRVDLKHVRDGHCAFDFPIPSLWEARARHAVVELEDGRELGDFKLPPRPAGLFPEDDGCWPRRLLGVEGYVEAFGPRIRGWVAPVDENTATELSVCEGDTEIFKIFCRDWRIDLDGASGGGGFGGFDMAAPLHVRDGRTRMLDIRHRGQSLLSEPFALTLAPPTAAEAKNAPPLWPRRLFGVEGHIENFGTRIQGWIAPVDAHTPGELSVFEGETEILKIFGLDWRIDLKGADGDGGFGGFDIAAPLHMRDGRTRLLDIRHRGQSLLGEPFPLTLAPPTAAEEKDAPPLWPRRLFGVEGHIENFGARIQGWIAPVDERTPGELSVFEGDTEILKIFGRDWRIDLKGASGDGGFGGFDIAAPLHMRDGRTRLLDIRHRGRSLLGEPFPLTLAPPTAAEEEDAPPLWPRRLFGVEGHIDCFGERIKGWIAPIDSFTPDELCVFEGDTELFKIVGRGWRADLEGVRGGGGNGAFDIPAPLHMRDGQARLLDIRHRGQSVLNEPFWLTLAPAAEGEIDDAPVWPRRFFGLEGSIDSFDERIKGWAVPINRGPPIVLSVCEGDTEIFTIEAKDWRKDLEDAHQGDGRGGFDVEAPLHIRDGRTRVLDVRYRGRSLISEPFAVTLAPAPEPDLPKTLEGRLIRRGQKLVEELTPRAKALVDELRPVDFTFIINFYNMRREAERTLTSLTRAYQRDSDNIRYEVICIDNGSNPPLEEDWIASFGPEFRLVRPSKILPSPCFAMNEAAMQARGKHVVAMVDGAHVLTPGVLREAKEAIREHANTVVAVRHWFVGGDQRWLTAVGYTRELEDILFARARWPSDGYKLFEIGATMHENPNHWFDPIAESNCLFVPAGLWRRMGGMDESFSEPGGGFCNLDLLRRAGAMAQDGVTALLGEATFHQFHEGTTTNVTDAEKDSRVRTYASKYRHMRGEEFANIDTTQLRLRGRMQTYRCYSTRQRPLFQAPLGVTARVRPGSMDRWLDLGAIEYINSAYVESGLHEKTRWRGEQINLAPADLTNLQEILHDTRPERIIITKHEPEIVRFLDDMIRLEGLEDTRIVCVVDETPNQPHSRVDYVVGEPYARETLSGVEVAVGAAESTLVLFSPREDDTFPLEQMRAYARFVSFRSYLVVLRTVLGQPWLGYSTYWLKRVIYLFLRNSNFAHDESRDQHLITMCSAGYLLRVQPGKPEPDDDALEDIAS